jgi:hypothetical protein
MDKVGDLAPAAKSLGGKEKRLSQPEFIWAGAGCFRYLCKMQCFIAPRL